MTVPTSPASPTHPATRAPEGGGVKVSVVVPVYNTEAYLVECLDSLLAQDLPAAEFEVVAVDDGSTDSSGELLDRYRDEHPNVHVVHQENSGWPGGPRNTGLAVARGEYVFFADSDDVLAPGALRRMHAFATEHASDVVVPKVVPLEGAAGPDYVWRRTQVDADLTRAILTLGPWKLFRRAFLAERGLAFPEGKVRLEDGILVTEAYLTARRVSLLADDAYYLKRAQPERGNISRTPVDPQGYASSIARMIEIIRKHCNDPALADVLVATLYRRKALKWFAADRFPGYKPARQQAWIEAAAALAEQHVPARLDEQLPLLHRTRSVLVRHREIAALAGLGEAQRAGRPVATALVDTWLELQVPGLAPGSALVVANGLRLVPAPEPARGSGGRDSGQVPEPAGGTASGRGLVAYARRHVRPVAQRSALGRSAWSWARARLGPARRPSS